MDVVFQVRLTFDMFKHLKNITQCTQCGCCIRSLKIQKFTSDADKNSCLLSNLKSNIIFPAAKL